MATLLPEPVSILPKFVVLRSRHNGKYLRYIPEGGSGGLLDFCGEDCVSPYSKFEVEFHSRKVEEGYINLRCCYNNKYWRRRDESVTNIISGDGEEAEADTTKWSCTLFKHFLSRTEHTVRLLHVQLGRYLCSVPSQSSAGQLLLAVESEEPKQDPSDVFEYLDWETIVQLPRNVAFKGDNGKYLRAKPLRLSTDHWYLPHDLNPEYPFLQFSSDDIGEEAVGHEVVPNPDGTIRIRSHHFNKFWRCQADNGFGLTRWIWPDMGNYADMYTSYRVVKVKNNVIALRTCAPDGHYCKRLTADGKTDCLSPMANIGTGSTPTIEKTAHLTVEELVVSRRIYDVEFREQDARVYNRILVSLDTAPLSNSLPEPISIKISLGGMETTKTNLSSSSSWSDSTSFSVDLKATKIPYFDGANIAFSSDHSEAQAWSTTKEFQRSIGRDVEVSVPAMSKVLVKLVATQATCDVPFSFTYRDILSSGIEATYRRDDGIATVTSSYNIAVDVSPATKLDAIP